MQPPLITVQQLSWLAICTRVEGRLVAWITFHCKGQSTCINVPSLGRGEQFRAMLVEELACQFKWDLQLGAFLGLRTFSDFDTFTAYGIIP